MKKRFLAAVLALAMLLMMVPSAFAASDGFDDVPGHWAEDAINRWSGYGVVNGVGDNQFAPNGTLTRAQAAQVFANLLDLEVQADISRYTDVPEGSWYHTAIAQCVAAGILTGTGGATMDPQSPVTREELFVMFARALNIRPQSSSDVTFGDSGEVSGWAQGYINALADRGFVSGVGGGMLAPGEAINRASVMSLLDKTISDYANTSGTTVGNASGVVLVVADNVSVAGDVDTLVVYGGSASVTGSQVAEATVAGENASLSVSGSAVVERVDVAGTEAVLTLTGSVRAGQVTVSGESAQVSLSGQAQAASVAVEETAAGAGLTVGAGSAVTTVDSAAANVIISGSGTVETANVSGNNTTVNTDGTDLTVAQGTTGVTENNKPVSGGTTVETQPEQPVTPPIYIPNYYTVTFVNTDKETIGSQTVVEYTTDLSGLAPEVTVGDGQQLKWHNGTSYVELSEITVTSNLTLTAVVGSNDFTAGNGTETYPYLISTADELKAMDGLNANFELATNIEVTMAEDCKYDTWYAGYVKNVSGVLEGNNHTITVNTPYGIDDGWYNSLFFNATNFELRNVTVENTTGNNLTTIMSAQVSGTTTLVNVTYRNDNIQEVDGNCAVFILNMYGDVSLDGCVNYADLNGTSYNAIFVGWKGGVKNNGVDVTPQTTMSIKNCANYGDLSCQDAALFLGNASNISKLTCVFENNTNYGVIRGTGSVRYGVADPNGKDSSKANAEYNTSALQSLGENVGTFELNYVDGTLALSKDENNNLVITKATHTDVGYYVVSVGLYTDYYDSEGNKHGTLRRYATETIRASEVTDTTYTCNLQVLSITDNADYADGTSIAGNPTKTNEGNTYYYFPVIGEDDLMSCVGAPGAPAVKEPTLIIVQAFSADGILLCSAELSID